MAEKQAVEPGVEGAGKTQQERPRKNPIADVEFQVSQVIGRLEEAVIGKGGSACPANPAVMPPVSDASTTPQLTSSSPPEGAEISDAAGTESCGEQPAVPLRSPTPVERGFSVMQQLEEMFLQDPDDPEEAVPLPELCETSRLAVVSHAVAALAGCMERNHVARLSARVSDDTARWIAQLFRCDGYGVCYHDDQLEGAVRVVRALLHARINHYAEHAYLAIKNRLPVIYTSIAAPVGIVQHLCRQLGLPVSCVNAIPCSTLFGSQKMDLAALEREIESDKAANKLPLIVLADAGTPIAGHVDNVCRLQEICRANDVWLHLRGHCLAALAVPESSNLVGYIADSMTLPLGIWMGIPGLPTATVYNQKVLHFGSTSLLDHPGRKLISLPIWTTFQSLGKERIRRRFQDAFDWCHQLWQRFNKYPSIRLLSQPPGGEGSVMRISDITSNPVNSNTLFEIAACTVVFQFVPENVEGRVPTYYDKLNSWLGQMLQRDCPQVNITLCEIENGEIVLRYCPLEPQPSVHEPPDFDLFTNCLEQQIEILTATVEHKIVFQQLVESSPLLRLVEVEGWAGLGGVRYQPQSFDDAQLTDHVKEQLNKLNVTLVDKLRATDAAFSLGEGADGLACVRFGMVTSDTDVGELLQLVVSAGQDVEESGKALDNMAEVLKRGIEAATLELQRESDEQMWQEGILRSMPVVGTFVNWWSPNSKQSSRGIKGRSLDLTAGIVASTENIYRYHMQTLQNEPLEQTSVSHSRSSSVSSSQMQTQQQP